MMTDNLPETSIIIRAFNEEQWLPHVFAALAKQQYRDFEVLLVDSGSVDRTREIAAEYGARIVRLRSEDFTFGHSLNVGVSEARGRLIAILSAHAIPASDAWLERLVAPLRQDDVAMVYGGQRGHEMSKFSEVCDFERIYPSKAERVHAADPFANNANSAIKRERWKEHPFDEGLPGLEDIEWAKHWSERDQQVVYVPDACIIHVHAESWAQVRRRYYREGMAARWVGLRILRHIPGEVWREMRWCAHDLWMAASRGRFIAIAGEILRFRIEKTLGTVGGIVDSKGMSNPARRAELFNQKGFQALVVRGPNRIRLEDRTVPSLKPGEVLVRVSHVGVCGTDLEILEGQLGYFQKGIASYPIVPGHEFSGSIVALGPRVTELSESDRVVVECIQGCGECDACKRDEAIRCRERREIGVIGQDGACATYFLTRARYVHRIPVDVTLAQAALTEPLAVVHKGLRRLGSTAQDDRPRSCAVIGAGTIGHLAARVLVSRGHSVTVFDRVRERLQSLNGTVATSETLQDLGRFEWLIEATGQQAVLSALLQQATTGSTLLLLGLPYADQSFNFESIVANDRSVIGSVGSSALDFREALATIPSIDTTPFLRATYSLEEYESALALARSQTVLKVMFTPSPPIERIHAT
jgi:2-desacetyl-2-hydroxyethyl bacteriochlorophyllide A dehydrogenase